MKRGKVHACFRGWGIIIGEDGEKLWVGYKDIDDESNERGFRDLMVGSEVTFKRKRDNYKYENMYKTTHKAVHIGTIRAN